MRKSPLMKIWDGDTLVGLAWSCTTASDSTPNQEEKEFMRIFTEHKNLTTDRDALLAACSKLLADMSDMIHLVQNGRGLDCFCFSSQAKAQAAIAQAKKE